MKKIILLSFLLVLLSACSTQYHTVQIVGKDRSSDAIVVRGMGALSSDATYIVTSAHVVRDDRLLYVAYGVQYIVSERDVSRDRAMLVPRGRENHSIPPLDSLFLRVSSGGMISARVERSGEFIDLTGRVLDPQGYITAYDSLGRINSLSGVVLTDLLLEPGDSGAPIFTTDGELVDVVHVR